MPTAPPVPGDSRDPRPSRRDCLQWGTAAALAAASWPARLAAQQERPVSPLAWPDLKLQDGRLLTAQAWQGQAAVLVFWATHCAFCRRHNVHIEKLHRALAGQPVRVLGLSSDRDPAVLGRYLRQQAMSFPVSMDVEPLRSLLRLSRTIPTTITIDRQGIPGLAIPGEMTEDDVLGLARVVLGS
jgi:thiol-disulfide isomerase/thioredoxin